MYLPSLFLSSFPLFSPKAKRHREIANERCVDILALLWFMFYHIPIGEEFTNTINVECGLLHVYLHASAAIVIIFIQSAVSLYHNGSFFETSVSLLRRHISV